MDRYNLTLLDEGFFTAYDENLDPTVANSFATAAFRFAHSLLPVSRNYSFLIALDLCFLVCHRSINL